MRRRFKCLIVAGIILISLFAITLYIYGYAELSGVAFVVCFGIPAFCIIAFLLQVSVTMGKASLEKKTPSEEQIIPNDRH